MTLTAETITDDQLRDLQREAQKIVAESSPYHLVFPIRERPGVELLYASTYALGENDVYLVGYTIAVPPGKEQAEYIQEGRRYCAELLNAVNKLKAANRTASWPSEPAVPQDSHDQGLPCAFCASRVPNIEGTSAEHRHAIVHEVVVCRRCLVLVETILSAAGSQPETNKP